MTISGNGLFVTALWPKWLVSCNRSLVTAGHNFPVGSSCTEIFSLAVPATEPKFGPGHSVTLTSAGTRNSHRSEKSEENRNFWPCGAQGCVFYCFLDCFINFHVACTQMTPNSGLKWHSGLL
jgi:hypothetical protein